jgi:uncharacterized protein VirK/YbjX
MANEFEAVLAINHDAQIAYEETCDSGFRNSYSALWEKFDAVECDRHVYRLNVPLKVRPLSCVNRAHRARARNRRRHWDEIVQSARLRMIDYRIPRGSSLTVELSDAPVLVRGDRLATLEAGR